MTESVRRLPYREIWALDFEFRAPEGERPDPICMVARELRSGRLLRLWQDDLRRQPWPPFPTDATSLFVAYYASAELGCFLALGWSMPARVLDLFVEFRVATNGLSLPCGSGLLGAMTWHNLDGMAADDKAEMRDLAMRGGPWSDAERTALLEYCQADVDALARLLPKMLPGILARQADPSVALGHTLLRGRYMAAAARMEWNGVPIDAAALERLQRHWEGIKVHLVTAVDGRYGVFDGTTFKADRFGHYLDQMGIAWPRHPNGSLTLDEETFRDMAKAYPVHPRQAPTELARGRQRRTQSLPVVGLPEPDRPQPAEQQSVCVRARHLD